ncbi:hypothetical protein ZWY2020_025011 [Hordeum vulgare]|nr:hypothetical protein ZWY2020_025011 [Hordeum vulgare]
MHDIIGGPGQTAVRVVKGQGPPHPSMSGSYFGDTVVMDDLLMEGPSLTSKAVGRAQGTYVLAAMGVPVLAVSVTVVITEGPYNGSTLVIACRPRRHLPGGKGDRGGRRDGTAPAGYRAQWRRQKNIIVGSAADRARAVEDGGGRVSGVHGAGAGRARDSTGRSCSCSWSSSWMGLVR